VLSEKKRSKMKRQNIDLLKNYLPRVQKHLNLPSRLKQRKRQKAPRRKPKKKQKGLWMKKLPTKSF
jgi:hypothetical protein